MARGDQRSMQPSPGERFVADDGGSGAGAVPAVVGYLHRPEGTAASGLVLTHGAGGNCDAALLVALGGAFAARGVAVLRVDLPYRQARPTGPPSPAGAARDREGLRRAVGALRAIVQGRVALGGQSYGGRQASMLAADAPDVADALLLLSYPLHPPGRPADLRTAHFPALRTPAVFAHGSLDPFGSLDELDAARASIPAPTALLAFDGAGHGLLRGRRVPPETVARIADALVEFMAARAT